MACGYEKDEGRRSIIAFGKVIFYCVGMPAGENGRADLTICLRKRGEMFEIWLLYCDIKI